MWWEEENACVCLCVELRVFLKTPMLCPYVLKTINNMGIALTLVFGTNDPPSYVDAHDDE